MRPSRAFVLAAWLVNSLAACGGDPDAPVDASTDATLVDASWSDATPLADAATELDASVIQGYPQYLAEWGLFTGNGSTQEPVDGVVPYAVISPLFSDYAAKRRFMHVPTGAQIGYEDEDHWNFPVGTILVKTFSYPYDMRDPEMGERLLETRILVHAEEDLWEPMTYVWNEEQTQATRTSIGTRISAMWIDADGTEQALSYRVPNTNQCKNCHGGAGDTGPLGPRTRQLDHDFDYGTGLTNQVDHLAMLGWFDVVPPAYESRTHMVNPLDESALLDTRARSYVESNCAHCHRDGGAATSSGLWLSWGITDPERLGICKRPPAAGRGTCGLDYDIVPGRSDISILACRIASSDPEIKMPELPVQLVDPVGVELLSAWIEAMPAASCTP